MMDPLLDRFCRYVRIDTQADEAVATYPSTPGQLELGRLLAEELRALGLRDAAQDEHGIVLATIPATVNHPAPAIAWIAHVDTSPETSGRNVKPVVHANYDGRDIVLPGDPTKVLRTADNPELLALRGKTIITSDGTTLLGADDKAGVAIIMAAVAYLAAHPELPRPTLRVGFTPDEEIGEGATLFDIPRFGAHCAYTLDGSEIGELQDETFSAFEVEVTVTGVDVHPGQATGKLVNALRLAAEIIVALPEDRLTPESTSGREGFIHFHELRGTAGRATLRAIVRDFDEDKLADHVELVKRTAEEVAASEPRAKVEIKVHRQYRNMRAYLESVPYITDAAEEAIRAEGIEPVRSPIRGGTDGSRLSEMGLPTPNIFTGGHEFHSVREWASAQDMAAAAATVIRLAEVWRRPEYADRAREEQPSRASG
jgi:tripeptide aminopeptidase